MQVLYSSSSSSLFPSLLPPSLLPFLFLLSPPCSLFPFLLLIHVDVTFTFRTGMQKAATSLPTMVTSYGTPNMFISARGTRRWITARQRATCVIHQVLFTLQTFLSPSPTTSSAHPPPFISPSSIAFLPHSRLFVSSSSLFALQIVLSCSHLALPHLHRILFPLPPPSSPSLFSLPLPSVSFYLIPLSLLHPLTQELLGCCLSASFGPKDTRRPVTCKKHSQTSFVDLRHASCIHYNCTRWWRGEGE